MSEGNKSDDDLMGPIPRKKKAKHPPPKSSLSSSASSFGGGGGSGSGGASALSYPPIPRKSGHQHHRGPPPQQQHFPHGGLAHHQQQPHYASAPPSHGNLKRPPSSSSIQHHYQPYHPHHFHQQQQQQQHRDRHSMPPRKKEKKSLHKSASFRSDQFGGFSSSNVNVSGREPQLYQHLQQQRGNDAAGPNIGAVAGWDPPLSAQDHMHQQRRNSNESPPQPFFPSSSLISVVSESPLILRLKATSMGSTTPVERHSRGSQRAPKRNRPDYQELELTDSDDFMTDDEAAGAAAAQPKKMARLVPFSSLLSSSSNAEPATVDMDAAAAAVLTSATAAVGADEAMEIMTTATTEGLVPPEGHLSTLWYSREEFAQIFVMEKILGFKTRPAVKLMKPPSDNVAPPTDLLEGELPMPPQPEPYVLDAAEALHIQQALLQNESFWPNVECRMEVSRAVPHHCPVILVAAAIREKHRAKQEGRKAAFYLAVDENRPREEVLLIKWRGRSHLHCSWERSNDLQKLDTSNNSTTRNKIRRYYQTQEAALGLAWKKILSSQQAGVQEGAESTDGEEYFPNNCLEIERILECDETEMNPDVLAKQRGRNMLYAEEEFQRRDNVQASPLDEPLGMGTQHATTSDSRESPVPTEYDAFRKLLENHPAILEALLRKDLHWDPEDNVRYVVKWKGLPYTEITWEYWRDIKLDAVNLAEDFWYRQKPPENYFPNRPHPQIQDFVKLSDSPLFGLSSRKRPIIGHGGADKEEDAFRGFKLRAYQLEGVNWLVFNWWNKRSCILADEMGLGKTIQSTAFLRELQTNPKTQVRGPFLIVAPLSLAGQWQSELASWAPDMNVVLYHGSADARDYLVQQEFYYNETFVGKNLATKLKKQNVLKFHVLITTYEVVLKDSTVLSKIRWKVLIVDEAHRLKNHKARLFDDLSAVPRDHCVLLTGTPIANATEELWALLHFANPKLFANRDEFLSKFGEMTDAQQVKELHTLLRPYLLRRVKEDVEKSLPPKEETILEVSLTPIQKQYYKAIYERNTSFLFKGAKASNAPSLMNVMMELRKCCNHPFLVTGAEERILADAAAKWKDKSGEDASLDNSKLFEDQLVKSSGKMVLMEKLLQKLFTGGHKVLIFSQMVRVLDLLEELLKLKKYRYERLDGSSSSSSRSASVERFIRKSCQRFVMLLSTRAGGLGLNLTAADVVIIFDSDWNPQNDLQAMARAHRIGQEKRVMIYRLLTAKTYEMHMFHSASLKLGLERAVLSQNREQGEESGDVDDKSKKTRGDRDAQRAQEIDELLKKGAYDIFRDDDDTEAEKFMKTDIDQLLADSSKKVTYGASATSSLGSGLGSFSKASFVAETDDGAKDVDLDDPDFWAKAIGLDAPVETPEDVAAMIDDGVKRSRKQVQVYDPYAETAEAEKRKQEQLLLEKQLEKEAKERQRQEKKAKKEAAKEQKRKEKEEQQRIKEEAARQAADAKEAAKKEAAAALTPAKKAPKPPPEPKPPKKSKKNERQVALLRAESENPVIEQLKQAWEPSQRSRATAAILRFGFGRFCKIRHESNLTSLPLQDIEIFSRSFLYQVALQVGAILLAFLHGGGNESDLRSVFKDWLGATYYPVELDFIVDSILEVMRCHEEVESYRRFLRMPVILADPPYVKELRKGGAFRALRRIGVISWLNRFIERMLHSILASLGHEQLGKRGCAYSDLSCLDMDLKARFVTIEELTLAIGASIRCLSGEQSNPAIWWDRECDASLILGTFIHGLGNYKAMGSDTDLCFTRKMKGVFETYGACRSAVDNFNVASKAARRVFDDALEAGRIKAELEVQAAVAAAAKAAKEREENAAVLREGGEGLEDAIKNMPDTQVDDAFKYDGTDSHFVTLPRMQAFVRSAVTNLGSSTKYAPRDEIAESAEEAPGGRGRHKEFLPMPDARVLDYRLILLLGEVERISSMSDGCLLSKGNIKSASDDVIASTKTRTEVLRRVIGKKARGWTNEFSGVGLGSYQCGTNHRSLDDGTDYGHGPASYQLAQVAYGTDAPRYLRRIGVPRNLTRYAVCALVHVDPNCVEEMLKGEMLQYYGNENGKPAAVDVEACGMSSEKEIVIDEKADNEMSVTKGDTVGEKNPIPESPQVTATKSSNGEGKLPLSQASPKGGAPNASPPSTVNPKVTRTYEKERLARIPVEFRTNPSLRAFVCMAVLLFGHPPNISGPVHPGLATSEGGYGLPDGFFDHSAFRSVVASLAGDVGVPADPIAFKYYVERFLIPHCLQLCLYGNGPSTRDSRGSQGEYETALGVNLHPEAGQPRQSPIPDPCVPVQKHSMEAICHASAILRRVQLLRATQYISSCKDLPPKLIEKVARSREMGDLRELPVWWCPWVHDIALVIQVATRGLFSIVKTRNQHPIFGPDGVETFFKSALSATDCGLPGSDHSSPEKVSEWIHNEAVKFPSMSVIERRLSYFCHLVTSKASNAEDRYCHLPMFDHGGWPRS